MKSYKLFWDEFSGWYLEIIKPDYQHPVDITAYRSTVAIFEKLMHIIHPFMPFITEEIWQLLGDRKEGESIMVRPMPEHKKHNKALVEQFETVKEIVSAIRMVRKTKDIPNKEKLELYIKADDSYDQYFLPVVSRLCNLSGITVVNKKKEGSASFIVGTLEYFIPLEAHVDIEGELKKIEEELAYTRGFLLSVMKKLGNDRFVQNAPVSVIETERKKKSDAETKIRALEDRKSELENII